MNDALGLRDRPILVIGGGSGIGRASALLLAECGARVAVGDLDPERARAVSDEVAATGVQTLAVSGDVTDPAGAQEVVDQAHRALGGLRGVINIIGLASWADLMTVDMETWERDLRVNLTQHLLVGRAAARHMIDDGVPGALSMVTSVSGLYGAPNHAAYGAAKAGATNLARTMANEWGPFNIRVNSVAPDIIATPRVVEGFHQGGRTDIDALAADDGVPLARFGRPEEIAGPLVFLISELASFISGQNIVVDGGTQARFPHGGVKAFDK
jgi:NAD(P)-dependent dehydrogenase (short-subunit alcohol dehydrogenase family)